MPWREETSFRRCVCLGFRVNQKLNHCPHRCDMGLTPEGNHLTRETDGLSLRLEGAQGRWARGGYSARKRRKRGRGRWGPAFKAARGRRKVTATPRGGPAAGKAGLSAAQLGHRSGRHLAQLQVRSPAKISAGYEHAGDFPRGASPTRRRCLAHALTREIGNA